MTCVVCQKILQDGYKRLGESYYHFECFKKAFKEGKKIDVTRYCFLGSAWHKRNYTYNHRLQTVVIGVEKVDINATFKIPFAEDIHFSEVKDLKARTLEVGPILEEKYFPGQSSLSRWGYAILEDGREAILNLAIGDNSSVAKVK